MAIIRTWDGVGLVAGTLDTTSAGTGDETFDQTAGTWTIDTGDAAHTRITSAVGTGGGRNVTWAALTGTAGRSAYRFYVTMSALTSGETELMMLNGAAGARSLRLYTRPDGTWLVRDSANATIGGSAATMQANQTYRVEVALQVAASTCQVYVYADETSTPLEVLNLSGTFIDVINVKFGQDGTDSSLIPQYWYRNMAVADDDTLIGAIAPFTPPPAPRVAVIGDSLTYQDGNGQTNLTAKLTAAGWDPTSIYWHGVGGKKLTVADTSGTTTMDNIAEARAALGTVDQWLIALGTNNVSDTDAQFNQNMDTVLNAIGSEGEVVWIGLAFYGATNTNAAHFNPLIQAKVQARANSRFCDWNSFIHNGRDETGLWVFPTDSTHMTAAGYDIRNQYYVDQLTGTGSGSNAIWWIHDGAAWQPYDLLQL